jgi:2-dehydropantoate 2-reductase
MRIAVMGSGGVGGYFGARLAAAHNDVTFIARGEHLAAMRSNGLEVASPLGNLRLDRVRAVASPADAAGADVVLFAVKMGDTVSAADAVRPLMRDGVMVVTLQNGVESADQILSVLPAAHVVPGVARIAARIDAPGRITHGGAFARIEMGERSGPASRPLADFHAACRAAGIDAVLVDDIVRALWLKFAMQAPAAALTTITREPIGPIRGTPGTRRLLEAAVAEVVAVSEACGTGLVAADTAAVLKAIDGLPPAMSSSMALDRDRGKPLELKGFSGAVVRLGGELGVPTPTHRFILDALAIADRRGR